MQTASPDRCSGAMEETDRRAMCSSRHAEHNLTPISIKKSVQDVMEGARTDHHGFGYKMDKKSAGAEGKKGGRLSAACCRPNRRARDQAHGNEMYQARANLSSKKPRACAMPSRSLNSRSWGRVPSWIPEKRGSSADMAARPSGVSRFPGPAP